MEQLRSRFDQTNEAAAGSRQALVQEPGQELERQRYFMEQAKRMVSELSEQLGRPLTCCINTFGCQMNARDS